MTYILVVIFFLCFIGLAAALFVVEYAMTRRDRKELFKPSTTAPSGRMPYREKVESGVAWIDNHEKEWISIKSEDGLNLKAFLILPSSPCGCIIAYHGFRSWPEREFAGMAEMLYNSGYAVLYPFQRSHRESEGKYITFGVKEKNDCRLWAELLADKFPFLPLWLYGQSMGGATVLMASGEKLPKSFCGVIADSAYNSPADIIKSILHNSYGIPAYPLIWLVNFWTRLLAGFSLFEISAVKRMRNDISYLFIHGTDDDLVPYEMGFQNYAYCPNPDKKFITVYGSGHCACCYKDESLYKTEFLSFLKRTSNIFN